eukprot:Nitzschia sp. Nitz4//scaffold62_size106224//90486//92739//NITZ4_004370-RA/size106224-processed-gene-0.59-mRNA-1//-1//CDS//3329555898//9383//frame0
MKHCISQPKGSRPSTLVSVLSLIVMGSLLASVVLFHAQKTNKTTTPAAFASTSQVNQEPYRRALFFDTDDSLYGDDGLPMDDDSAEAQVCREFVDKFLNGTTDLNDECLAMKAAFNTAGCKNASSTTIWNIIFEDAPDVESADDDEWKPKCCDAIDKVFQSRCKETKGVYHSVRLLAIMLVLLVCTFIKAILKRAHIQWLPDACAFILVGAFVSGTLSLFGSTFVGNKLSFDNDLFLQIMLPPIIFEAALSIDKRAFRRDLFPILTFAGLGTAFSAVAIGWITHQVSQWGSSGHLPLLDSMVFGALIASIDPVATLSILSGVGVSQTDTLYTLIFGESLLNDGVAIALFDTLKTFLGEDIELNDEAYKSMAKHFGVVLFGSIGIGLGVGICCTVYFWFLRGQQTAVTEVAIFFCWALIPYYIAEAVECSGIIAIMILGFFVDYFVVGGFQSEDSSWMDYIAMRSEDEDGVAVQPHEDGVSRFMKSFASAFSGRGHILSRSRHHVGFVAEVISSLMETAIFAYLGLFLFSDNMWNIRLSLTAVLSCVTSRAIMVVVLSLMINAAVFLDIENQIGKLFTSIRSINLADDDSLNTRTRIYLDRKTQMILFLAGVRGAVSFALVESIPVWDPVEKTGSHYKSELKAMTSTSIVFTLFVFGALTYMTVKAGNTRIELSGENIAGAALSDRLLNEPLDSDDENQSGIASSLEIDFAHRQALRAEAARVPSE